MIQNISIDPHKIKGYTCLTLNTKGPMDGFPFLSVDRDSYLVGVEVQSGINFDIDSGRHCIAIGKCCSLAESITFMIDLNHDYKSVCQGGLSFLSDMRVTSKIPRKGSIILQNDVWVGHGATVMAGVTLHNGCVVAADSVITKDVPPYAIVGGNPAKILQYRFNEDTVAGLQKIAWWDWPVEIQKERRDDFLLPASEFVSKYLPEAEMRLQKVHISNLHRDINKKKSILLIPDFSEPYPLYPKIFKQYFSKDRSDKELIIYVPGRESKPENLQILNKILQQYESVDCDVILQVGEDLDESILFQHADYFITTRSCETVFRTCLADLYGTKIIYGTDEPLSCN